MTVTALDTNIILLNANIIYSFSGADVVVLTDTVLSELDNKKTGHGEVSYQAREFGRLMAKSTFIESVSYDTCTVVKLKVGSTFLHIVTNVDYSSVPTSEYNTNDFKILHALKEYRTSIGIPIDVLSNDTYMRIQAMINGFEVSEFKIIEDDGFEFIKVMCIEDTELFKDLHYSKVIEVDEEHSPDNFSYMFQCVETGQVKIAIVQNGMINVIGKDTEKELRNQRVHPSNMEQLLAARAIQDPSIDLVCIEGRAGSGKNICALSNAMKLFDMHRDKYEGIVYIRSPQNDESPGEDIGYLSSNEAKYALYLEPLEDTLNFIARSAMPPEKKVKLDEYAATVDLRVQELKEKYGISSRITTGLRGLTYHNTILIIDEAQNCSAATMQKTLTRVGKNCKVIVIGSQNQIDSKYVTKWNNGLSILMGQDYKDAPIKGFNIVFSSVSRSDMAEFAENLFTSIK
jgi:PhoH-like ATPase